MKEQEMVKFVDLLYPFVKEKLINDGFLKNFIQRKNAIVKSTLATDSTNIGSLVDVALPGENVIFKVKNETGVDLNLGNMVVIEYNIDLKNAIAVYKI